MARDVGRDRCEDVRNEIEQFECRANQATRIVSQKLSQLACPPSVVEGTKVPGAASKAALVESLVGQDAGATAQSRMAARIVSAEARCARSKCPPLWALPCTSSRGGHEEAEALLLAGQPGIVDKSGKARPVAVNLAHVAVGALLFPARARPGRRPCGSTTRRSVQRSG